MLEMHNGLFDFISIVFCYPQLGESRNRPRHRSVIVSILEKSLTWGTTGKEYLCPFDPMEYHQL